MQIIKTGDGSSSIYRSDIDEHYHSVHGAIAEAKHVFIQYGLVAYNLQFPDKKKLEVLEVGFGTGLNASLLMESAEKLDVQVNYFGVEPFPLEGTLINQLDYPGINQGYFKQIHQSDWGVAVDLSPFFNIDKQQEKLLDCNPSQAVDLVFFDAFGPNAQPEMWEQDVFDYLYKRMSNHSLLTTYCAKGQVKRNLKAAGFKIEAQPGPPGKREMTQAWKNG